RVVCTAGQFGTPRWGAADTRKGEPAKVIGSTLFYLAVAAATTPGKSPSFARKHFPPRQHGRSAWGLVPGRPARRSACDLSFTPAGGDAHGPGRAVHDPVRGRRPGEPADV